MRSTSVAAAASPDLAGGDDLSGQLRTLTAERTWVRLAGPVASLAVLAVCFYELRTLSLREVAALLPLSPLFWAVFALRFVLTPAIEWTIYRRLWRLPARGFGALVGKLVSNELLLGYLGEVYFYAWVRRHLKLAAAPFGAIKDVAILSAIAGNIATLLLVVAVYPLVSGLDLGLSREAWLGSFVIVVGSSLVITLLRGRLFSLPRAELRYVLAAHGVRIAASMLLTALLWHLLLPTVGIELWLLLATVRQLVSRLPLVPNKDIVFAGITAFVVGGSTEVTAAMTLMATLGLAANLIAGLAMGARGLAAEAAR